MPTQLTAEASLLERRSTFWFVAALIALLFATTNLPWTLDDYDQAKQAFTSFEMVNEGHWLYEHTPNERIATKPPLVGWVSAAIYGVSRKWEIAWRLPSLVAAVALAIVLLRAATSAYGAAAGLLALSAFGLNMLSPRLATLVRTDMPLALVVSLLGLRIWAKVRSAEAWRARDRLEMFALLTAAMLIKGPIVYAFLLPGIVAFSFWRRRDINAVTAWCGWWPWLASLAVFLVWVAAGIKWVPGFYEQVVVREFAGRFGETLHRPQPFYFYLPHLLHKFAPWSVLGVALAVVNRRRRCSPEIAWLLCWSLAGLALMSLIPSKRVDRIFPIVPPLCLLLAAGVAHGITPRVQRWTVTALVAGCAFSSIYAAQRVILSYRADNAALVQFGREVRRAAATSGWRYEVIGGKEEGLLLYLRKTHFVKADEAVLRWNSAEVDAVVAPAQLASSLVARMPGAVVSNVRVNHGEAAYLLLVK